MATAKRWAQKVMSTQRRLVPAPVKRLVARMSPLEYFLEDPIGQVFLADDDFDTYLCLNDFYTILNPERPAPAYAHVELHGARGEVLVARDVDLAPAGSMAISTRELLAEVGARCAVGLATAQLRPRAPDTDAVEAYKAMGRIASHFFTYYLNTRTEAMAIIHPQSSVGQTRDGATPGWRSGQSIVTAGLRGISLYQANHGRTPAEVAYRLHDAATGRSIAEKSIRVAATSAAAAHFAMADLDPLPSVIHLRCDRFPTPNGKPLLMRRYDGGRFSMNHS
jgi:hypothetical protein